jgi:hypothetical protein
MTDDTTKGREEPPGPALPSKTPPGLPVWVFLAAGGLVMLALIFYALIG